jgi:hypothetical protein
MALAFGMRVNGSVSIMSEQAPTRSRTVKGRIRSRLLVNALVDPDEAAMQLPRGLRPHVTPEGTVVGCCLLEIEHIRPSFLPAVAGRRLRAAAHRISAEWDDDAGRTTVGVYVPMRHTDSRLAVALGGRWFPGVHSPARVEWSDANDVLRWTVASTDCADGFAIAVAAAISGAVEQRIDGNPTGRTCLDATIGLSPDRNGVLEGARLQPDHREAVRVTIDHLDSAFLAGFSSARPATSYLMRDVGVVWTSAPTPDLLAGAGR